MKVFSLPSTLARTTSTIALAIGLALPGAAFAQTAPATPAAPQDPATEAAEDIVVTGVRASLERSIAIKRNSTGIVDAISAEDIGKFPDTNLAESLQRITGVSISRRNGEGADVTVRGFSSQYNLVTLNGRQLAASAQQPVGGDESADFGRNTSRSFDFSNLASEGVRTLEVYKTSRAAVPSGGIGASINIVTRRPLDVKDPGFTGTIGAKGVYDMSTDDCVSCGAHVTPEVSGLASWSNPDQTIGISLFGSYQKRNFTNISATVNDWNITTLAQFLDPNSGNVNAATKINNAPTNANTLVGRPNDFRYHFGEGSRERLNGQAVLQFKPTESLDISIDGLYARNKLSERRSDQANWFNRPFDVVTFDSGNSVATTSYLHETITGASKDAGFEQQYRAQKNELYDVGFNAKWDVTNNFRLALDGHLGRSTSNPDNPNGMSSTLVAISSPTLAQHSVDYSGGFPVQTVQFLDPVGSKGNGNGVLDVGDLGSQVGRQVATRLTQRIKEARIDAGWDFGAGSRLDFGGSYRTTDTRSTQTTYYQTLGDWGNAQPRDVNTLASGVVQPFCLVCRFADNDPKATGDALTAFRAQDPTKLYNILSAAYTARGNANAIDGRVDDSVKEDIFAAYSQVTWKGEIAGAKASVVAGVRFESTKVKSSSLQAIPLNILWQSDNDFLLVLSPTFQPVTDSGRYNNVLPGLDFQVELSRNLIGRFSFGRTIARPSYGNLFASIGVTKPSDATAVGGLAGGSSNNANLQPLISDNLDLSLEYYFKPDSYISAGFFDKRVHNFIGNTIVQRQLFGLRDPSSGVAGSRSGTAKTVLQGLGADITNVNLFTYTALLQQTGSVAAATAQFNANYNPATRSLNQQFVDSTLAAVDITANATDPLFNFNVNTSINNKDAEIYGFEIAGQYFFGDTGIGISAAYTLVRGDVGIDLAAPVAVDQFALVGLSDTANATLIYDKYGISARLSYNYRAKFLSALNRNAFHSPEITAPYSQVDMNISYDITPHIAVSFEAINLNKEGVKTYGRSPNQIWLVQEGQRRFLFGARYRF